MNGEATRWWTEQERQFQEQAKLRTLVCPECGGKKSWMAYKCWRCAGLKEPKPKDKVARTRALNALRRAYDPGSEYRGWQMSDDEIIAVGQQKTDIDLLRLRNFGQSSLRWLRSQPDTGMLPPKVTKDNFVPLSITRGEWLDFLGRRVIDYTAAITKLLREAADLLEEDGHDDLVKRIKQTLREENNDANN